MKNSKFIIFSIIITIILIYILFKIKFVIGLSFVSIILFLSIFLNRASIYAFMGNQSFGKKDLTSAMKYYKKALSIRNCKSSICINYGYLLLKNGLIDEADEAFNKINKNVLSASESSQYKMTYSLVLWKKNMLDAALEMLEDVYSSYKCTTVFESFGYLLILKGDYEKALQINLEGYEYNDADNVIVDNLGETYFYLGQMDKALEIYENLLEKNPNFPEPYYYYALVLNNLGKKDNALEMLNKALSFKESNLSALTHLKIQTEIQRINSL
jgi:Flp pilus assembly protein TadD, contains TPR repeats